ncbi:MAG: Gfo/Idh/MocA family oxidoreductase [Ardenticatenia bacterium]|nr:Gfo/Idh/MocA family oxidoreductase [Ardenticatenia bacterium]
MRLFWQTSHPSPPATGDQLAAASRGVHVLCDKPMATTLAEADAIVEEARRAGIKLMVPFNPRFQLPVMRCKHELDTGQAGKLVAIYAVKYGKLPTWAPGPQRADWFLNPRQAGGGGFLDIGIHAVDALRWLAGAEATRVHAHMATCVHPLEAEDLGVMTVNLPTAWWECSVRGGSTPRRLPLGWTCASRC